MRSSCGALNSGLRVRAFLSRLTLSVMAVLIVLVCEPAGQAAVKESLSVAVTTLGNEALDPIKGPSDNGRYLRFMFDPLVGTDFTGTRLSKDTGIARDWTVSSDHKTFTFTLRQGVKFHNGDDVTADDVKFSLERLRGPGVVSTLGPTIAAVLDTVTVKNRYSVVVTLKQPTVNFLVYLSPLRDVSGLVLPQKYFQSVGADGFAQKPIGSGPCKFVGRQVGASITFEAAGPTHYAVGKPRFKRVTFRLVPEESTRVAMLKSGEVDFIDVSYDKVAGLKQGGFQIFQQPLPTFYPLHFQAWRPGEATADVNVRKALSYAINRQELNEKLLGGLGQLSGAPFFGQPGVQAIAPDPYDPVQAKAFLNQTEFRDGGKPLTMQIQTAPTGGFPALAVAEAVQGYWKKIGVNSVITYRDFGAMRADWTAGKLPAPAVILFDVGARLDWLSNAQNLYGCKGALHGACDPQLEKLIDAWALATTPAAAESAANATAKFLHDNTTVIPLVAMGALYAGNANIPSDFSPGNFSTTFNERALIWEKK